MTALFGGSPSNIAFSFLNKEKIEVVTGVNLPMILTFWKKREVESLKGLAKSLQLSGTRSIVRTKVLMETINAIERGTPSQDRRLSKK